MSLLGRLLACLRAVWRAERRGAMQPPAHESVEYTDSDPIVSTLDEDQARALERVRQQYHQGTDNLTVARARYDLLRRGNDAS